MASAASGFNFGQFRIEASNLLRTGRMNQFYYAVLLQRYKGFNLCMEILIALTASGSALTAWQFFSTSLGIQIWAVASGLATLLGIIKPMLVLPAKIEQYGKLKTGYLEQFNQLQDLIADIQLGKVTSHDEMIKRYESARDIMRRLEVSGDSSEYRKLLRKCYERVLKEIPADKIWQ
jgi:hypothetical protein